MYSKEIIQGFMKVATASVADAVDKVAGRRGYMEHSIKPRISEKKIVGPAVTVKEVPTDEFVPPQHALDAEGAGTVLLAVPDGHGQGRRQVRPHSPSSISP